MATYEIELKRAGSRSQLRLSDHALTPGQTLLIGGTLWRVLQTTRTPRSREAVVRYVCVPYTL